MTLSAALIAGAVQAAPVGLAKSVTLVAMTKGVAASGSTLTLIEGALKIMAWTKAKTAVVAGAIVVLAAGTTTVITVKKAHEHQIPVSQGGIFKSDANTGATNNGSLDVAFTSIGVTLTMKDQTLEIAGVIPNSNAEKAGLRRGLIIQQIDGANIAGKSLGECAGMMRGATGSKIKIGVSDTTNGKTKIVEFTRDRNPVPLPFH